MHEPTFMNSSSPQDCTTDRWWPNAHHCRSVILVSGDQTLIIAGLCCKSKVILGLSTPDKTLNWWWSCHYNSRIEHQTSGDSVLSPLVLNQRWWPWPSPLTFHCQGPKPTVIGILTQQWWPFSSSALFIEQKRMGVWAHKSLWRPPPHH